jgi:hypothetical protein
MIQPHASHAGTRSARVGLALIAPHAEQDVELIGEPVGTDEPTPKAMGSHTQACCRTVREPLVGSAWGCRWQTIPATFGPGMEAGEPARCLGLSPAACGGDTSGTAPP